MVYAVITEDGLDQVCYAKADAQREAKDLRAMGFTVKVRTFESEDAAEDWHARRR